MLYSRICGSFERCPRRPSPLSPPSIHKQHDLSLEWSFYAEVRRSTIRILQNQQHASARCGCATQDLALTSSRTLSTSVVIDTTYILRIARNAKSHRNRSAKMPKRPEARIKQLSTCHSFRCLPFLGVFMVLTCPET